MKSEMEKNLQEHIREHYLSVSLSAKQLEELSDHLYCDRSLEQSYTSHNTRLQFYMRVLAVAALLAIAALPWSYHLGIQVGQSEVRLHKASQPESGAREIKNPVSTQLVAIKLHADWCNRCPLIAPGFKRMTREFGTKPILFITLDLTNDDRRLQSERIADALGIKWLLDQEHRTGIVVLVDRKTKQTLAVVTGPNEWPLLASAIGANLPD